MNVLEKAKVFIYRNARPLDLARWQYHFENGSKEAVLTALAYYQNEDGGFAHALEPDAWNPNSSPIQTWAATEILHEIDFTDSSHPLIIGILTYLESGQDFADSLWYNTIASNNDYPHAPWWHASNGSTHYDSYNPSACLAGFIVRHAAEQSSLYRLGERIVMNAYEYLLSPEWQIEMHLISCYIRMLDYCQEAGTSAIDTAVLEERLRQAVSASITKDTSAWGVSYITKPSQFFNPKRSVFYEDNKEIADYEADFIVRTQLDDGSWDIPWSWGDYPDAWAISKNWWQGHAIISNLLFLKGMGKLSF